MLLVAGVALVTLLIGTLHLASGSELFMSQDIQARPKLGKFAPANFILTNLAGRVRENTGSPLSNRFE
jgi:hypothetical protein